MNTTVPVFVNVVHHSPGVVTAFHRAIFTTRRPPTATVTPSLPRGTTPLASPGARPPPHTHRVGGHFTHPVHPRLVQQVQDLLIVELHELGGDFEVGGGLAGLPSGLLSLAHPSEEVIHGAGNDTDRLRAGIHLKPGAHRVRLAGARLWGAERDGQMVICVRLAGARLWGAERDGQMVICVRLTGARLWGAETDG